VRDGEGGFNAFMNRLKRLPRLSVFGCFGADPRGGCCLGGIANQVMGEGRAAIRITRSRQAPKAQADTLARACRMVDRASDAGPAANHLSLQSSVGELVGEGDEQVSRT
jgi:hypothetical protein